MDNDDSTVDGEGGDLGELITVDFGNRERDVPIRRTMARGWPCEHRLTEIDKEARRLTCRTCGVELDPIAFIWKIAEGGTRLGWVRDELKELRTTIEELRGEEKRIKARLRRATRNAEPLEGELELLRRLEAAARQMKPKIISRTLTELSVLRGTIR